MQIIWSKQFTSKIGKLRLITNNLDLKTKSKKYIEAIKRSGFILHQQVSNKIDVTYRYSLEKAYNTSDRAREAIIWVYPRNVQKQLHKEVRK